MDNVNKVASQIIASAISPILSSKNIEIENLKKQLKELNEKYDDLYIRNENMITKLANVMRGVKIED